MEMKIGQRQESGYESVSISHVGIADPYALEGILVLKTYDGREFHMKSFSGEVAKYIKEYMESGKRDMPTIYKLVEEVCEHGNIVLVKIKIYESGKTVRANMYFAGKKDLVLRNYRASDAIALATYYNAPIMVRKRLLDNSGD